MPLPTINEVWEKYEKEVVPEEAGEVQRKESRRAFFAGAMAIFAMYIAIADGFSDDDAEKELLSIESQLKKFSEDIANGKA